MRPEHEPLEDEIIISRFHVKFRGRKIKVLYMILRTLISTTNQPIPKSYQSYAIFQLMNLLHPFPTSPSLDSEVDPCVFFWREDESMFMDFDDIIHDIIIHNVVESSDFKVLLLLLLLLLLSWSSPSVKRKPLRINIECFLFQLLCSS